MREGERDAERKSERMGMHADILHKFIFSLYIHKQFAFRCMHGSVRRQEKAGGAHMN